MAHKLTQRHKNGMGESPQPSRNQELGKPPALRQSKIGAAPLLGEYGTDIIPPTEYPSVLTERALQQRMVIWYKNTYCLTLHRPRCLILSIPNERKLNLIRTGLYPGGADLLVIHLTAVKSPSLQTRSQSVGKRGNGVNMRVIFVEVKTPEGIVSPKQKKFETHIKSMNGKVEYYVVRSLEQFQKIIISNAI